ncbi:MAG: hypothetical protein ABI824_18290 [Acidobacteriota bacterium]
MVWLLALTLALDLSAVRQEPNLEKRSDLALEVANSEIGVARDAYQQGRLEPSQSALVQVKEAVALSKTSLVATGKDPRKNSKYFKRAELATREILRRLLGLRDSMDGVDRSMIDPVISEITIVHDDLLHGVMTGSH